MATELTSDPKWSSLISKVRQACPDGVKPRLVHRLDRVTRGIVVVALTGAGASYYGEQIREGMWDKVYLARIPRPDPRRNPLHEGLVGKHKAFIKEVDKRAVIVRAGGAPSFLEVLAVEPAPGFAGEAHALIRLLTGRLHQIRVMLAALGLPLTGDDFYGGAPRGGGFYLEHAVLRYIDCTTRDLTVAHVRDDPERERLGPALGARLAALAEDRSPPG
ncbi:MAG TPA: hypothetical protein DEB06_06865 [Phycisphaerales bacterium]|nr:hypothetical protein [Phycisphaerales bacterium]